MNLKSWKQIVCKNCGKSCKTKIPDIELCSIPCILEWREEEEYAKSEKFHLSNKSEVK